MKKYGKNYGKTKKKLIFHGVSFMLVKQDLRCFFIIVLQCDEFHDKIKIKILGGYISRLVLTPISVTFIEASLFFLQNWIIAEKRLSFTK